MLRRILYYHGVQKHLCVTMNFNENIILDKRDGYILNVVISYKKLIRLFNLQE